MLRTSTSPRTSARRGSDTRSARRTAGALLAAALVCAPVGAASAVTASSGTSSTTVTDAVTATAPSPSAPLSWEPPALTTPITITVSPTKRNLKLTAGQDYIIKMPATPLTGLHGLQIHGGRNIVLIGGQIDLPLAAIDSSTHAGRGLYIHNQTGTVHVEGLHITGEGLEEGINIAAPEAVVQLQNIRVDLVHGSKSGHHADVIQSWSGPKVLRVDGLTGYTQYQGFFLLPTQFGAPEPELFDIRRTDLHGTPDSAYMLWRDGLTWPLTVQEVYVAPKNPLHRDSFLWPKGTAQGAEAWPFVKVGSPAVGEFVPASKVGLRYTSPGYAEPVAAAQQLVEVNPAEGVLESVTPVAGGLRVTGWAADRDTTSPISVDVVAGGATHRVVADVPRTDVAALGTGLPGTVGFDTVVPLPVGPHDVCVTALNVASGTDTALGCRTATVADTTAPTVTGGPAVSLRTGIASLTGVMPVTAAWSVTDDVAVAATRLTSPVAEAYAPGVSSVDHQVATGTSRWTLEADDAAGNTATASSDVTVTYVPETSADRYNYWWTPQSSKFFGGTALRTNRGGASMSHTFTGSSVAWVASRESAGGLADVYVDGVKEATVDLAAPSTVQRSVVFTRSWDTPGAHTITVVALGGSGKYVTSDGFVTVG